MIKAISLLSIVGLGATYGFLRWQARDNVARAGFWFEDITYELPHLEAAGLGGALTITEQETIRRVASAELRAAFAGLRITFSEDRDAFYRVRVMQEFDGGTAGAAGATRVLPPLGGSGSVNFLMLGSHAVTHRPQGATRAMVIDGIGRGIARAAVHEFLHQILPRVRIHDSTDRESYEFGYSARPAQYYGPMRWDIARAPLEQRLGYR